jgi:hypothetical protein
VIKKFLAAFASLMLVGLSIGASYSVATANQPGSNYDFLACVKNSKTGSVVILMDESGSIYGSGDNPGSDPNRMRITGAQILIDDLQRVVDVSQGEIKVQLAGLGDNFVSRTGGWVSLTARDAETSSELKTLAADAWSNRPQDGNSRETDMLSSLAGAQNVLKPEVGCKLLVIFKDGKDWQYLNPNNTSPVDFPLVQQAVDAGDFIAAKREAQNEICRPLGIADGFRADDVNMLAVALGSGGFEELRALVNGGNCGQRPGIGSVLNALDPSGLPSLFRRALDPSYEPSEFEGSFEFAMTNDLQGITVLTSGLSSISDLKIQPPSGCQAVQLPNANSKGASGELASGVAWKATPYGNSGTVQVNLTNVDRANTDCWNGNWSVEPGNSTAKSVVEVDPNLEAIAEFEDSDVYLVPGSETPTNFEVILRQLSDGTPVPASSLGENSRVNVQGFLIDEDNNVTSVFGQGALDRDGLENPISWTVPSDLEYGSYKLILSTSLEIPGVSLESRTVSWERDIEVRGEVLSPVVVNAPINFGEIDGTNKSYAEVEVLNRSDKDLILLLDQTTLSLEQAPSELQYEIKSDVQELVLAAGSTQKFKLELSAMAERVDSFGSVAGDVEMLAAVAEAQNKTAPFSGDFFGTQQASADENARLWLIVIFMLIAGLGTLGAVALVNYLASRFPKADEVAEISAFAADVRIGQYGLELTSGELSDRIYREQWNSVDFVNRRTLSVDGTEIRAKSPGLKLSGNGYGLSSDPRFGFGSESTSVLAGQRLGLAVEGGYLVSTELSQAEVTKAASTGEVIPGKIVLFTKDRSKAEKIFSAASSSPLIAGLAGMTPAKEKPAKTSSNKGEKRSKAIKENVVEAEPEIQKSVDNDDFW